MWLCGLQYSFHTRFFFLLSLCLGIYCWMIGWMVWYGFGFDIKGEVARADKRTWGDKCDQIALCEIHKESIKVNNKKRKKWSLITLEIPKRIKFLIQISCHICNTNNSNLSKLSRIYIKIQQFKNKMSNKQK